MLNTGARLAGPDERVRVVGLPARDPLILQTLQRRLFRYARAGCRRVGSGLSGNGHDLDPREVRYGGHASFTLRLPTLAESRGGFPFSARENS